jgi:transcriptional regulator with XRE-family HTH domain
LPTAPARPHDLASVLSSLQRASGHSLRALGTRTGLSPSFLSRLMSGERFPTWKDAAAIADACGADPLVLRRVWQDAEARRDKGVRPQTLDSALRYLHMRAGSPTPWVMASKSGTLTEEEIIGLLDGTAVPDWEDVALLVQVLDGEPSFFRPLWERTTARRTPAPLCPVVRTRSQPAKKKPARRIDDLLSAFHEALGGAAPSPPQHRRPLLAPIQAVTHWTGS